MPVVKCPHCGATLHTDDLIPVTSLSSAAYHVLHSAPDAIRRGQVVSVQAIADLTGYSPSHTYRVLRELARAGYVEKIPIGTRKHRYCG